MTKEGSFAKGAAYGVASAALFGLGAPLSKLLLPNVSSVELAGLLYAGAGIGLSIVAATPWFRASPTDADTRLRRTDLPILAAIVASGGIVGPVLMLAGLRLVSGVAGALLLNLEGVFTVMFAMLFFGEHLSGREGMAVAAVIAGAATVTYTPGTPSATAVGVLAVAGACAAWGLDNNLTRVLSHRDPIRLVRIKTLGAGTCNLAIAAALGERGHAIPLGAAFVVGFLCYGISIVLDMLALRHLGAAREAAFFATAPFIGAVAAVPLLGESLMATQLAGGAVIAAGVALLIGLRDHANEGLT